MTAEKLTQLRQIMSKNGADFYYIPSTDPHHDEYVPNTWQRRAFISGFTGSAGDVVVGKKSAYFWTDPRYTLQAQLQLDDSLYEIVNARHLIDWLATQPDKFVLALDPSLISPTLAEKLNSLATLKQGSLLYPEKNWVDLIWKNKPPLPSTPIQLHPIKYAGLSVQEKLIAVRAELEQEVADYLILNSLEEIAWLLNIRGKDIDFNPLTLANAIVSENSVTLFVDPQKIQPEVAEYFKHEKITTKPYETFKKELNALKGSVLVDPKLCNHWITTEITGDIVFGESPITLLKALKNETEQKGMKEAHLQDALAVIKFLQWLETTWQQGVTELSAQEKLKNFRLENPACVDLSFETISGFGPHGAIIHYSADEKSSLPIDDSSLYLVDSGGQYLSGTTDITRTVALGDPTLQQKKQYTLVLKGHLALAASIFPKGTHGEELNALAHLPLWKEGLDYGHGTGHGVGSYACVHQSPPSISSRKTLHALQPGMVLSNEPGVYLENQYGIRIENLMLVRDTSLESKTGHGPFYGFETLTLVPYANKLIDKTLLSREEIDQINRYHERIYTLLHPLVTDSALLAWLKENTSTLYVSTHS